MNNQKPQEPEIVGREQALKNFRSALQNSEIPHIETLRGKQELLERYFFDTNGYALWGLVNSCKSVIGLPRVSVLHYHPGQLSEKPVKRDKVKKELEGIRDSINAFCAEGTARNEILMTLSHLLKKRLRDQRGLDIDPLINLNLLIELRTVIIENLDQLVDAVIKKGTPPKTDLVVAYLLTVFKTVFPDESPSRGDQSLCFNFILTALQSCAPDDHLPGLDKIRVKLGGRIRDQLGDKPEWFEYSEEADRIVPITHLLQEIRDYPELAEMRQLD